MRSLKSFRGFTATELLVVTTLLSSIPVSGYIGVKSKALQVQCAHQLRQIGIAVRLFVMSEGHYPDAAFYPEKPLEDPKSILAFVKQYDCGGELFICPTAPDALKKKGLTFLWNDALSGEPAACVRKPAETWMMVDMTALDERVSSHQGGYNVLYADGHVAWSSKPPLIKPHK